MAIEKEARITVTWNFTKSTDFERLSGNSFLMKAFPLLLYCLLSLQLAIPIQLYNLPERQEIAHKFWVGWSFLIKLPPDFSRRYYTNMTLKPGDKAPDFEVQDQSGSTVKLSDFKGRKLVLYFYPRDNTPTCTREACNLRDNYQHFKEKGYEILGISSDDEKSHQKFISKYELPFSLLADTEKQVHQAYGTWIQKSMYGRKYMGTARVTFVIDENGIIEQVIDKVKAKEHSRQILGSS